MSLPEISFAHLRRLTDDRGLFEHARGTVARRHLGYCVDDVARALVVVSREGAELQDLAAVYLRFLVDAQVPDGRFRNRLGLTGRWSDLPSVEDCWGRALWGLGAAVAGHPDARSSDAADASLTAFTTGASWRSPYRHSMAFAALLIGFARGIHVVMEEGRIVDTIVHGLFTPIADLPVTLSALAMLAAHGVIHVPVPSTSGQAVLTLPLLVPLSDLIGLSRQVTVLAYQYGAGLCELLTPTNGALMAMLAACGIPYEQWLRFAMPVLGVLVALAAAAIGAAVVAGV